MARTSSTFSLCSAFSLLHEQSSVWKLRLVQVWSVRFTLSLRDSESVCVGGGWTMSAGLWFEINSLNFPFLELFLVLLFVLKEEA